MEIFLVWFVFAFLVAIAASSRGRSGAAWFLISAVLSPLVGLILVLVLPNLRHEQLLQTLAGRGPAPPRASLGGKATRVSIDRSDRPFTPDGVYAGAPYRAERDGSITAMMSGGLVVFRSVEQFQAAMEGKTFRDAGGIDRQVIESRYPEESGDVRYRIEKDGRVFAWSHETGERVFKDWRTFFDATHR
jgi:hypothetical protein